jgi:hypothetical protein
MHIEKSEENESASHFSARREPVVLGVIEVEVYNVVFALGHHFLRAKEQNTELQISHYLQPRVNGHRLLKSFGAHLNEFVHRYI